MLYTLTAGSILAVAISAGAGGAGGSWMGLGLLFGAIVGLSLGLTGSGGSILAVPLLVYGLGLGPREAVSVSLAVVGSTALAGALQRIRSGEVEVGTGLLFSAAGMLGAPAGSWVGERIPEILLLFLFAGLMGFVAVRMWRKAEQAPEESAAVRAGFNLRGAEERGPACRRDPSGRLRMTSRCAVMLAAVGLAAGGLSGLFGVGGGFMIVPALVLFTGMGVHRAVSTSLLIITLVSAAGIASHLALVPGGSFPWGPTFVLAAGGVLGMGIGSLLAGRISGPSLQRGFAGVILAVAAFIIIKNLLAIL